MIYLDNAATSFPKAPGVATAMSGQILGTGGNPGRASHRMAQDAARMVFDAREAAASLVGVRDARRLIFTQNATEALNVAIVGSLKSGAVVAVSSLEHNAVMRPLRYLEARAGVKVIVFSCDPCGRPDPAELRDALAAGPDLLVCTMASNVTGALLPVDEIGRMCAASAIPFGLDGSQAIGHSMFDFDNSGAAFLCFPGHKGLMGPTGTGALCLAEGFLPEPLYRGGTGSRSDSEFQPDFLPDRFEAGTRNLAGIAGLLAAVRFVSKMGIREIGEKESTLAHRLAEGLAALPGLRLFGPWSRDSAAADTICRDYNRAEMRIGFRIGVGIDARAVEGCVPVVSFTVDGRTVSDLAHELDRRDIAVRMGLHCAPAAHRSIGTFASGGTVRMSPGYFTSMAEVDEAVAALREILR